MSTVMSPMAAGSIKTPSEPFSQMKLEVCLYVYLASLSSLYFTSLLTSLSLSLSPARWVVTQWEQCQQFDEDLPRHQELLLCRGEVS